MVFQLQMNNLTKGGKMIKDEKKQIGDLTIKLYELLDEVMDYGYP